ncbi:MAG: hypothetical protein AB8F65_14815 [Woeseiaceae bacterium]
MRALLLIVFGLLVADVSAEEIDPKSGLIVDEHWELALGFCGSCHSYKLVTAQRGDREYWLKTIRWMQKTQNLWAIPKPLEDQLLDYLAKNYNESDWGRRPPLPARLVPEEEG